MHQNSPRVPALSPDRFTAEHKALVGDWGNLNFSRVIVQHPDLYRTFIPLVDKLIRGSNLPARDREILVLRTLALAEDVYETHHHVLIARRAGMTDAEIEAAQTGGGSLSGFDKSLAGAAEELVRDHCVSDETWQALAERYSQAQRMEVVSLVGCYALMAMLTNSFGMQVEQDSEAFEQLGKLRQYI